MKKKLYNFFISILILIMLFSTVSSASAHTVPTVTEGYDIECVFNSDTNAYECEISGSICKTGEVRVSISIELIEFEYVVTETCKTLPPPIKVDKIVSGASLDLYQGYCGAFLTMPNFDGEATLTQVNTPPTGLNYQHYACQIEYFNDTGNLLGYTGTFAFVYFNLTEIQAAEYAEGDISLYTHNGESWSACKYLYHMPNEGEFGRLSCLTVDTMFAVGEN